MAKSFQDRAKEREELVAKAKALEEAGFQSDGLLQLLSDIGVTDGLISNGALRNKVMRTDLSEITNHFEITPGTELQQPDVSNTDGKVFYRVRGAERAPRFMGGGMHPLSNAEKELYPGDPRERYVLRKKEAE
jgi:hypothetical protein